MIAQFLSDWNFCDVDEGKIHGARKVDEEEEEEEKIFKSLRYFNIKNLLGRNLSKSDGCKKLMK